MKPLRLLIVLILALGPGGNADSRPALATPDTPENFDDDLATDLAIGVPGEDNLYFRSGAVSNAGQIQVLYGNLMQGLDDSGDQYLHQDVSGAEGVAEEGDAFGAQLAAGDFDCDGLYDLAVGVPSEEVNGVTYAGAVQVFYSQGNGLGTGSGGRDDQLWHQDNTSAGEAPEFFDQFGAALAAGDFDGNGCADLAIGVPSENPGAVFAAGAVQVLYGSAANGLSTTGEDLFFQGPGSLGIQTPETDDYFGSALAAGDFNGDGRDDLAIGVSSEDFEDPLRTAVGVVHIIYGTDSGLTTVGHDYTHQNAFEMQDDAETGDSFGAALATGDFDADGYDDLAVGVPGEMWGTFDASGAVQYIFGSAAGLSSDDRLLFQEDLGFDSHPNNYFGGVLASGDFNRDGRADLAIASIGKELDHLGPYDCGAVDVIYGFAYGLTVVGAMEFVQGQNGLPDDCEADDNFGEALAAGDFNADGFADLAVGVPDEDLEDIGGVDYADAGQVHLLYGGPGGLSAAKTKVLSQADAGIAGDPYHDDFFGDALASTPGHAQAAYLPLMWRMP